MISPHGLQLDNDLLRSGQGGEGNENLASKETIIIVFCKRKGSRKE